MTELTKEQIKRQKALAWLKRVAYENPCMKEVKTCIEVLSAPAQPAIPEQQQPIAYIFKHPAGRLFWSLTDESNKWQADVIPIYTEPHELKIPPAIEPDYEVIKGILPTANPDEYACCVAADMWNACRAEMLKAQPVIQRELRSFVTDADIAALHRFAECCDDPESGGHDLEKEQVQRLEKIGVLQRSGRISYITDFGDYLISATAPINAQPVSEPYKLPSGYALVPCKLTAENGAKSCMISEFTEQTEISCPECFGDDECETCDGSGMIEVTVPVSWTTIKDIWVKGIEHFAAAADQEQK